MAGVILHGGNFPGRKLKWWEYAWWWDFSGGNIHDRILKWRDFFGGNLRWWKFESAGKLRHTIPMSDFHSSSLVQLQNSVHN